MTCLQRRGFPDAARLAAVAGLIALAIPCAWIDAGQPARGIVVEQGAPPLLEPGDVLLAWRRQPNPPANPEGAGGELATPFDLAAVLVEQRPRGVLLLLGERAGAALEVEVPVRQLGLVTWPRLSSAQRAAYSGVQRRQDHDPSGLAAAELGRLLVEARRRDDRELGAWLVHAARANQRGLQEWQGPDWWQTWPTATANDPVLRGIVDATAGEALHNSNRAAASNQATQAAMRAHLALQPESAGLAHALNARARAAWELRRAELAEGLYSRSLDIRRRLAPASLDLAQSLSNLGFLAQEEADYDAAELLGRGALAIQERLDPRGPSVAMSLNNLAMQALNQGRIDDGERLFRRSLAIHEAMAEPSIALAQTLNNLGVVAFYRGDLAGAEACHRRALEVKQEIAPDSLSVATSFNNLGNIATERGDLALAEASHRRALGIRQRLAPGSTDEAMSLNNLGHVAENRRDFAAAQGWFSRALEVYANLGAENVHVATIMENLGRALLEQGDDAAAEAWQRRAVELKTRIAPASLELAQGWGNLAAVLRERGDLDGAEQLLVSALQLQEEEAPHSLHRAKTLHQLALVARDRGEAAEMEGLSRRGLELVVELAPGSTLEAELRQLLAATLRATGRRDEAADCLARAVDALEGQAGRLGGSEEDLIRFRESMIDVYRDYLDLLVNLGRPEESFHVLERSRARGFLTMLAERDLVFTRDLPAGLELERRETNVRYRRLLEQLAILPGDAPAEERSRLEEELEEVRRGQLEIRGRIRAAAPELAALQYPEPLDLAATAAVLEPSTLLLAFAEGNGRSFLFALGPGTHGLAVYPIAVDQTALGEMVGSFRGRIQAGRGGGRLEALRPLAVRLAEALVAPVAGRLAEAERVVVLPIGALHLLPFAALAGSDATAGRWLVEDRPVSVVASATVLAELVKQRRARSAVRVAAFGDPDYGQDDPAAFGEAPTRGSEPPGGRLAPLPATRLEVAILAGTFPDTAAIWLGADATESRVRALDKRWTIVHFATHGLVDERFPLDSALALSVPRDRASGEDDGRLQAWEIFEQVRLDADLVTLSACSTALGQDVAGEGILGLTRAFQYAGARSVLASLWSVADLSTAAFMRSFYGALKAGQTKDVALQTAQLDLIHGRAALGDGASSAGQDWSHPFHWAAFELIGDWR